MASKGMVVAAQPEAVEAGALALMQGGNAVDAAMATALVQGVVDPQMTGIAGFGNLQLYLPEEGQHYNIDFHGRAPAAATADMWQDRIVGEAPDGFGFILDGNVNDVGYQAITVPGSLKAYYEAHQAHGVLDWADIVQPAISASERGVMVRPAMVYFWSEDDGSGRVISVERLKMSASGRRIYFNADGGLKRAGQMLHNPDLTETLKRIAAQGAEVFYTGAIAERIAEDMAANGGLLSYDDLANYRTTRTEPLWGSYRDYRVATCQPPGGGVVLLEMMNMLEHFDLAAMGHNSVDYVRTLAEVMKRATSDKDRYVGDPAFVDVPLGRLLDKAYAADLAGAIKAGEKAHVERFVVARESANTTHVSVVDGAGNCVTMTHSLGMPSGVITEGLGFMYNDCMGVFDPRPGRADSLAPGKSRFSALCPSIVFAGGEPRIVIGAPGGTQITMGVLQAILNVLDFDMSMLEAVAAPRVSATSDAIDVSNRVPRFVTDALEAKGYEVRRSFLTYAFAGVHGIAIEDRQWQGGADPGRDGMALAV